ncbi:MAG TPA: nitrilase-related carbon-nitrogen hydrolase, partial [Thermoanaerobaculia bacterium]|nr:nitrilase-related carbon-nitrogen hydrolase [Thermoanaerobaculia bacterium]
MRTFLAACVQMNATEDREATLHQAMDLIDRAADRGAELIALPENVDQIARHSVKIEAAEPLDGPTFDRFAAKARERKIWLLAGTIAERSPQPGKGRNTSVLFDPEGDRAAVYRKIHLFDVEL